MDNWNLMDKFMGKLRYIHVEKYITHGSVIVDIGCGREATFLKRYKDIIDHGIGFDFRIENTVFDNITLINNKELSSFPLEDESVDTIFLNAVLEHLTDPHSVLVDCYRILKKGGRIVMTTPTRTAKPVLEIMAYKLHVINEAEIREHVHYYSKEDIRELAAELKMGLVRYSYFELGFNSIIVLEK